MEKQKNSKVGIPPWFKQWFEKISKDDKSMIEICFDAYQMGKGVKRKKKKT